MEQKQFHDREHRFSADDLAGLKVTFSRETNVEEIFQAEMLDFSKRGLKLKVPVNLHFEEKINIKILVDDFEVWFNGEGSIRHIRENGEQSWIVGCAIAPTIRDEVISELAAASGKERRGFPRIKVYGEATIQSEGHVSKRPAYIENISESGFCVFTPIEIPADSRIKVEVQDRTFQYYSVDAVTHWQISAEDGYKTGCSFADTSGYKNMIKCVSEQNDAMMGKEPGVSRIVLAAAVLTMLLPPFISLMWQTNAEPVAEQNRIVIREPDTTTNRPVDSFRQFEVSQNTSETSVADLPVKVLPTAVLDAPVTKAPKTLDNDDAVIVADPREPAGNADQRPSSDDNVPAGNTSPAKPLSPVRVWVDNSGEYKIKAELLAVHENSIEIRKADGSIKEVPFDRLSRKDLQYLFRVK